MEEVEVHIQKMVKLTNRDQFERLVHLMESNIDLARGFTRSGKDLKIEVKDRWAKIADELNSLGPPTRDADGWLKVWSDFKYKIKKKRVHNAKERKATGGGPNKLLSFTPLEDKVADLLNMDVAINPGGYEFGCISGHAIAGTSTELQKRSLTDEVEKETALTEAEESAMMDILFEDDIERAVPESTKYSAAMTQKNKNKSNKGEMQVKRMKFLEKQTEIQESLYKDVKNALHEIKDNSKENLEYTKKTYYLQKEKMKLLKEILEVKKEALKLKQEDLKDKQRQRREKLKLKVQIFELKKKQLYLQECDK